MSLPDFFSLNDRPVKIVKHPDGSFEAMALDMSTGDWVSGLEQLDRYFRRDGELELLDEQSFKARVSEIRKELGVPEFD
jgi:hypothetical protein